MRICVLTSINTLSHKKSRSCSRTFSLLLEFESGFCGRSRSTKLFKQGKIEDSASLITNISNTLSMATINFLHNARFGGQPTAMQRHSQRLQSQNELNHPSTARNTHMTTVLICILRKTNEQKIKHCKGPNSQRLHTSLTHTQHVYSVYCKHFDTRESNQHTCKKYDRQ